jgi:hypothetical protein
MKHFRSTSNISRRYQSIRNICWSRNIFSVTTSGTTVKIMNITAHTIQRTQVHWSFINQYHMLTTKCQDNYWFMTALSTHFKFCTKMKAVGHEMGATTTWFNSMREMLRVAQLKLDWHQHTRRSKIYGTTHPYLQRHIITKNAARELATTDVQQC